MTTDFQQGEGYAVDFIQTTDTQFPYKRRNHMNFLVPSVDGFSIKRVFKSLVGKYDRNHQIGEM